MHLFILKSVENSTIPDFGTAETLLKISLCKLWLTVGMPVSARICIKNKNKI
jgi:hypothetical protein